MEYAVRIGAPSMDNLDDLPGITQISWRSPDLFRGPGKPGESGA